nr:sigma-70 family RNA polymerase sigma factor [Tissierella carlieri]
MNISRLNSKGGLGVARNEEKELVRKLRKGNEEAYIELLDIYGNRLLKTCYLILKNEKDAEDIVQDTFLRVFNQIDNYNGNSSLYTWIYRIALNLCKDKIKSRREFEIYEDIFETKEKVEDIVFNSIDREILRRELFNLNALYREILILFYFEELAIKEISEILEEKEGTIKSRLSRGRVILKNAIERGGELYE